MRLRLGLGVALVTLSAIGLVPTSAVARSGWTIQSTPNPSGATESTLTSVACPTTTQCTAVGSSTNSAGVTTTLAERWNGVNWSIQPTPNPSGAAESALTSVACPTTTKCIAVGWYVTDPSAIPTPFLTLAEQWNGAVWSITPTPAVPGASASSLAAVSCSSSGGCDAVGRYTCPQDGACSVPSDGGPGPLAEHWNGRQWAFQTTFNTFGDGGLLGITCLPTTCTAVGDYVTAPPAVVELTLAEGWNRRQWTIQPTPISPSSIGLLNAVSCPSTTTCLAVGDPRINGENANLAELWNGATWSVVPTPQPGGGSQLLGVSCPSTTLCIAAGSYEAGTPVPALLQIARWNGTRWRSEPITSPSSTANSFSGVSCPSTTVCVAVGSFIDTSDGGTQVTLAEGYSG